MYYVFAIIFLCLGLFMTFMPEQSVKKENRDSENEINRARRNGIMLTAISIVLIIVLFIFVK